jgi:hypothetical protein
MTQVRDFAGISLCLFRPHPHPNVMLYSPHFLRDFLGFPPI